MKLTENYEMFKSGQSVDIVKTVGVNGKGKPITRAAHYGTVYQALQGFMHLRLSDLLEEGIDINTMGHKVESILSDILGAEEEIKKHFCVEVGVNE